MNSWQKIWIGMVLCTFGAVGIAQPGAEPKESLTLNISEQPLGNALAEFAQQAKLQVVFYSEIGEGFRSPHLAGSFSPRAALDRLLADTRLSYEFLDARTVVIRSAVSGGSATSSIYGPEQRAGDTTGTMRLVQSDSANSGSTAQAAQASASAQESNRTASTESAIQEIVVTAQKREEKLQDVPISISVLSGSDLDESRAQGVTDALRRVPGVSVIEAAQGGGTQLTVRGATNWPILAGGSPVAYYVDAVPFGFVRHAIAPDASAYDLSRVEVLRGPQGTLYGAGGAAGVVRVLTNDANLSELEFKARGSVSSTDGGGESYRGDMAINVPIVEDKLAIRAVLGYQDLAGWIDAPSGERDINDGQLANYRFKLGAKPTEKLTLSLSSWTSKSDYDALALSDDDAVFNSDLGQPTSAKFSAHSATIGYEFSGFSLTSATSYIDYSNDGDQDLRWLFNDAWRLITKLDSRVFSEELLLNSINEGKWEWSLGTFYRDAKDHALQPLIAPFGTIIAGDWEDTSESYAVFGEIHRRLLDDKLKLTLGIRYFHDDNATQGFAVDLNRYETTSEAWTPRAVVTWFPSADLTVYASYSQGFRSGMAQYEAVTATLPFFPAVEPDKLQNYEIGAKGNLFGRRLAFEVALYYADWQDIQQVLTVAFSNGLFGPGLDNGPSASGLGAEFSLSTEPVEGLELGAGVGWNDLTFDSQFVDGLGNVVADAGARTGASPEYTAIGFAEYAFPLGGSGLEGRIAGSANYTAGQNVSTLEGAVTSESIFVTRAAISVGDPDSWTASLYGENLNNERDAIFAGLVPEWSPRLRPRTVGLQLEYRF